MIIIKIKSKIEENEIIEDIYFINDTEFVRYYHHNIIPTRYFVSRNGDVYSEISNTILMPNLTIKGYHKVNIFINNKKKPKPISVHKLVGLVFLYDSYVPGYDIDHLDGIKIHNYVDNLEWVPRSINIQRAFDNGLKHAIHGNDNVNTIYKDEIIHEACKLLLEGKTIQNVSEITNIPKSYLYTIIRGESRKDIVDQYNLSKDIYTVPYNPLSEDIKNKIIHLYLDEHKSAKEISVLLNITNMTKIYNTIYTSKEYKLQRLSPSGP